MAIIRCKMCGGDLNIVEGASTAQCDFCGSVQTIPNLDDEKKLIQFERAERLRKQCEFDKAAGIYESIVADFRQESEAYWGLVLCKFGIEYVDDPATGRKVPTCHRSSFDSIMDDSDFEQALENADSIARRVYQEEAKAIEEIRKGIIAVSSNEAPYDIFICYKETAENGDRTLDSVLAQDVYDALTDRGYRVFFSRISLEDKLGVEYEPYIFAALNSAKIMLAFGTDYEYFNAVWVKNEWSRFLRLMAKDKGKHLIPCFKGIDAYDMPKEFTKLQAQDLGKVGAVQDLLRGIEKILPRQQVTVQETTVVQQAVGNSNPTVESYLTRAFMFLQDSKWDEADAYCEKVLDIAPQNGQAYLGKLMAELRINKREDLQDHIGWIEGQDNYQKVLRFADQELRSMLQLFEEQFVVKEKARREKQMCVNYNAAIKLLQQGEKSLAYDLLKRLSGYKDADALLETLKNDILSVLAYVELNGKYGYINESGEIVIQPQFDDARFFDPNGLASVKLNGKYGYINEVGAMVIQPQFDDAWFFAPNGLARVERNYKWGYINEAGEMVIQPQFDDADDFDPNGLARVERNGKYGYINEAGEMVIQPQFDDADDFAPNGLARVERNGKYGYINEAGEIVIQPQFDDARSFDPNGLARVERNYKWGYINEAGEMVIQPQFDDAWFFDPNGLARVERNGKYGYINEAGEMVIQPQFDAADVFAPNGLAPVRLNGKYGYINESGEIVIQPQFDDAGYFALDGLAPVKLNGKYGYINEVGAMVIQPQFDYAGSFDPDGLARVKLNGKYGDINEVGAMVIRPQFGYDNEVSTKFFSIIFRSKVEHAKQIQEMAAQKIRIAEEKAAEEKRIAEEKAAEEKRIAEEKAAEEKRIAEEKAKRQADELIFRRSAGLCQHCGGVLKGLFLKKCVSCGKPKDY